MGSSRGTLVLQVRDADNRSLTAVWHDVLEHSSGPMPRPSEEQSIIHGSSWAIGRSAANKQIPVVLKVGPAQTKVIHSTTQASTHRGTLAALPLDWKVLLT